MYVGSPIYQGVANYNSINVYIFLDDRYPNSWLPKYTSHGLAKYLIQVFNAYGVNVSLVDGDGLKSIVSRDPSGDILVMVQDVLPYSVWNGSPNSLIVRWIRDGGVLVWTGDWEFYYYGFSNGSSFHLEGMEAVPFGRAVTSAVNVSVASVGDLTRKYIPGFRGFRSYRPFDRDLLYGLYYEAYGVGSYGGREYIDPGLIRLGRGYFVKIGGCFEGALGLLDRAIYIGEFILNRFAGLNVSLFAGREYFDSCGQSIVYILPPKASSDYWMKRYGDRIYFYAYENLSEYRDYIDEDFRLISFYYSNVIIVMPLIENELVYHNIMVLDSLADKYGLGIIYSIFPKWFYGEEWLYLVSGSEANYALRHIMDFMVMQSSTRGVAIWFGWPNMMDKIDLIRDFYLHLDPELRKYYIVWIDEPMVSGLVEAGLPNLLDSLGIPAITELYSNLPIALYGYSFSRQMIVTGVWGMENTMSWRNRVVRKLSYMFIDPNKSYIPRKVGIWIFWDVDDGSNELYRAYINGALANPLNNETNLVRYKFIDIIYVNTPSGGLHKYVSKVSFAWEPNKNITLCVAEYTPYEYMGRSAQPTKIYVFVRWVWLDAWWEGGRLGQLIVYREIHLSIRQ